MGVFKRKFLQTLLLSTVMFLLIAGFSLDITISATKQLQVASAVVLAASAEEPLGIEPEWTFYSLPLGDCGEVRVNLFTGNLIFSSNDMAFNGVAFKRVYNSMGQGEPTLGEGWMLNYHCKVSECLDGSVLYVDPDGTVFRYNKTNLGTYITPAGLQKVLERVQEDNETYLVLSSEDGQSKEYFTLDHKLKKIILRQGEMISFVYTGDILSEIITHSGEVISLSSNSHGHITGIDDLLGQTVEYKRDFFGRINGFTSTLGIAFTYDYDSLDRLNLICDGQGNPTTIAYDSEGRVESIENADGYITGFEYNSLQTVVTTPKGQDYTYNFNSSGLVTSIVEPGSITTQYGWDSENRLTSVGDPLLPSRSYRYDADGHLYEELNGKGGATQYNYTNDVLTSVVDPSGVSMNYTYIYHYPTLAEYHLTDDGGNTVEIMAGSTWVNVTEPNGVTLYYHYNDRGNVEKVASNGSSISAHYNYDEHDNLEEIVIAGPYITYSTTKYVYDKLSRLTDIYDPDGNHTVQSYDENGNLKSILHPDNQLVEYTYTGTNQLETISFNGNVMYRFAYDANGNLLQVINTTSGGSTVTTGHTFDDQDRIDQTVTPDGISMDYDFDNIGNLIDVYVSGENFSGHFHFDYNPNNQPTKVQEPGGTEIGLNYGENGRSEGTTYPHQAVETIDYSQGSRVKFYDESGSNFTIREEYKYDKNGNLTHKTDEQGRTWMYWYNNQNQLAQEYDPVIHEYTLYKYDELGNLSEKWNQRGLIDPVMPSKFVKYEYLPATEPTPPHPGTDEYHPIQHDSRGNVYSDFEHRYIWDAGNRLIRVLDKWENIEIASYTYDYQGKRTSKTTSKGTTRYHYVGDRVAFETDGTGALLRMYTYTPTGAPLSVFTGEKTYYYHTNPRGDVRAISDSDGNLIQQFVYDSWGKIREEQIDLAIENPFLWGGYRFDEETGLYYIHGKYYNPRYGRYLSKTPSTNLPLQPDKLNPWTYAYNNPMTLVDSGSFYWSPFWNQWWWPVWGPWAMWTCSGCGTVTAIGPWWWPMWGPWWGPFGSMQGQWHSPWVGPQWGPWYTARWTPNWWSWVRPWWSSWHGPFWWPWWWQWQAPWWSWPGALWFTPWWYPWQWFVGIVWFLCHACGYLNWGWLWLAGRRWWL